MVIDLSGTTVQALPLEPIETYRSEHDWIVIRREVKTSMQRADR